MTTFQIEQTPDRPGVAAGSPLKFVLSSVQSDSHMWNLVASS